LLWKKILVEGTERVNMSNCKKKGGGRKRGGIGEEGVTSKTSEEEEGGRYTRKSPDFASAAKSAKKEGGELKEGKGKSLWRGKKSRSNEKRNARRSVRE